MLPVELIDKILFEHKNDEALSQTLGRLGITQPKGGKWAEELHELGILEIYGAPDYLQLTPFGKEVKAKGGWSKYNTKPLFDRILQKLFELQDSDKFHNLIELFPDVDKDVVRNKARELQRQKLIDIKPTGFYTTVIGSPNATPSDIERQKHQREVYNTQLLAKITWAGFQYYKGNQGTSIITTVNDKSTHQNISGSTIHGPVSQSSDFSSNKNTVSPVESPKKREMNTITKILIGGLITLIVTVVSALILVNCFGINP